MEKLPNLKNIKTPEDAKNIEKSPIDISKASSLLVKNEQANLFSKGLLSQEDFDRLVGECYKVITKHTIKESRHEVIFGGNLTSKFILRDKLGNEYNATMHEDVHYESIEKDDERIAWCVTTYKVNIPHSVSKNEEMDEYFDLFIEHENSFTKVDPFTKGGIEERTTTNITRTPEELEEIFEDIRGYFAKKENL